jgi:zinc protease
MRSRIAVYHPSAFAAVVAFACCITSLPLAAQAPSAVAGQTIRSDTLANGMTVIVVENRSVPMATAHVVFRGGAMTQTSELQGVPHLFEHMLFRSYRGTNENSFALDAGQIGAAYNGATSDEEVSYTMWFPSDKFGGVLQLLADLVRDPIIKDKDVQTERFVVRNEMMRAQSEPEFLMSTAVAQALWGEWFPRKNTIGNDLSLFSATAARLKVLYDMWYVPNNAALVVTGDVSAEKVFGEARKQFGKWRRRGDPFVANPIPVPPPLDSVRAVVYTHEVKTITVQMSWRGPTLRDDKPSTRDASAMADVLNADDSNFQRNMVDAGYFQSAGFSVTNNQFGSELSFRGVTTPEKLLVALGAFGDEMRRFIYPMYFDSTALVAAVQRRRVGRSLAFEESASLASSLGSAWALTGTDAASANEDVLSQRTPETIAAFATKYMSNKPYVIGLLTPVSAEQAATQTISQFIVYLRDQ